MSWVESVSPSFRARHDEADADDVVRVLHSLELTRERLSDFFDRTPGDIDVVFHGSAMSLTVARPLVPVARLLVAPAARRYIAGAARWFAGQTDHARPAIARRLREGPPPSFPPGIRDAPLLGGTVVDLLAIERGEDAVAELATRLHPQGTRAALTRAFRRPVPETERAWRAHLVSG